MSPEPITKLTDATAVVKEIRHIYSLLTKQGNAVANASLVVPVQITAADSPFTPENRAAVDADASVGLVEIQLPKAARSVGFLILIAKVDGSGNVVRVRGDGVDPISGASFVDLLAQYEDLILTCNGTFWSVR